MVWYLIVSYTRKWVCDIALIGCTLSLGKPKRGRDSKGKGTRGQWGTMGDKGSQFTSNLGLRWTIPVTAGGSQVSKGEYNKGNIARGNTPYTLYILTRVRVHIGMIELMKDTSCMYDNNNRMNAVDNLKLCLGYK